MSLLLLLVPKKSLAWISGTTGSLFPWLRRRSRLPTTTSLYFQSADRTAVFVQHSPHENGFSSLVDKPGTENSHNPLEDAKSKARFLEAFDSLSLRTTSEPLQPTAVDSNGGTTTTLAPGNTGFRVTAPFLPTGDQPEAIEKLLQQLKEKDLPRAILRGRYES